MFSKFSIKSHYVALAGLDLLYKPGWPQTHKGPCASPFKVLELKVFIREQIEMFYPLTPANQYVVLIVLNYVQIEK